jgi:MraZ protein
VINLIGEHSCKADAKGRVMFPSAFKKKLAPVLEKGFVLKKSIFEPCLELFPMDVWDKTMAEVGSKNRFDRDTNTFIRKFSAGVKLIELDAAGRFLITKDLCDFAGIKKEIIMTGAVDIIEIWNKVDYEKSIDEETVNFTKLTKKVMGNSNSDKNE